MSFVSALFWAACTSGFFYTARADFVQSHRSPDCRFLPGDAGWPNHHDWATLNSTVEGRLIQTVPLAALCHNPTYNGTECASLKALWAWPNYHEDDPTSIINPWFQNSSCDPFTPELSPCLLGNYPDYSINVSSWQDAAAGILFAEKKNVRLVIKNTGHDCLGKSSGRGSLSLWTHNIRDIEILDHSSISYTGKAAKMGAGVRGFEAYEVAHAQGLTLVGGSCPTVGLTGGYTQGGGHSILSSLYGLGADQALEWEVVTAQGQHLIATPTQTSDLYWALSGGGPGTYGVVISLTVRAHPDGLFGGASLAFSTAGISNDTFWSAIAYWQTLTPSFVDAGYTTAHIITASSFAISPLTAPGASVAETTALLAPFTTYLTGQGIVFFLNVTSLSFLDHFETYLGPLTTGSYPAVQLLGGRLVPRSVVEFKNTALVSAIRNIIGTSTFYFILISLNVGHPTGTAPIAANAVLPAWRDAVFQVLVQSPWDFTLPRSVEVEREEYLTDVIGPTLAELTPGSGTYLNEGDFNDPNWKQDFYGVNYERLREIKKKYDPTDLFFAITAVGSDAWVVTAEERLCRA